MSFDGDKLYHLLPALYRARDLQAAQSQGLKHGPLECLLKLIAEQVAVVEEDLAQFYDDQFIETCAPWVIPYIGNLIGYQSVSPATEARSEVANTISLRRRKGTILALERLAADVTGWGAHAVEFFKVLACTQHMNHLRPGNHGAPNLRRWQVREYMGTGFDATAHTVDVRRIAVERGRHNIQNIGIFLWSLNAYPMVNAPAAPSSADPLCFRFSSLGADMPLFNNPAAPSADITPLTQPVNVPDYLRRRVLWQDMKAGAASVYYGQGKSLTLSVDGTLLDADQILVCNLSGEEGHWANLPVPAPYLAAVDPELGRIALPAASPPPAQVTTTHYYGFTANMGGGAYNRVISAEPDQKVIQWPGSEPSDLQSALDSLDGDGVVEIATNDYYKESGLNISVNPDGHIELRGANGFRPTLVLSGPITVTGGENSAFDLSGLVISVDTETGGLFPALVHAPNGGTNLLSGLGLTDCTLVPGGALTPRGEPYDPHGPGLVAETSNLQVVINNSILGGIFISPDATATISNSIVDATARTGVAYAGLDGSSSGGALTMTCCTVIGKIHATLLTLVSNSILWAELSPEDSPPGSWTAPVIADRKQQGCVRFTYLPPASAIPRNFQCVTMNSPTGVPGLESPEPLFACLRYGLPGYAKLLASTPDVVRRGADDGGEMGAFHFVNAPLLEHDLRVRMQEYLPAGLEFGIFYET